MTGGARGQNRGGTGLALGEVLRDRYKINAMIGISGFEITYKAWDKLDAKDVAIKEYCPQELLSRASGQADYMLVEEYNDEYTYGLQKFMQEAKSLAAFKGNDNIVTVYDYFEEGYTGFMVMEYLNGLSLKEYMERRDNKVSEEMMINVSFSVIEALEEIHTAGMVHRDLSPESIFICDDNKVKLIDFGVVEMDTSRENLSSTIVLKPGYAPVEQYSGGNKTGPWTDIYALGATLYYITTGTRPVDAPSRVFSDELKEPRKINARIPRALNRAIMKAMSIKKEDRYPSAVAMAQDIMEGDAGTGEKPQAEEKTEPAPLSAVELGDSMLQSPGEKLNAKLEFTPAQEQKPASEASQRPKSAFKLADAKSRAMENHSFMLAHAEQSGVLTAQDRLPEAKPVVTSEQLRKQREQKKEYKKRDERAIRVLYRFMTIIAVLFLFIPLALYGINRALGKKTGVRLENVCVNASETDLVTSRKKFSPSEKRYYHFEIEGLKDTQMMTVIVKIQSPGDKPREHIIGLVDNDYQGFVEVTYDGSEDFEGGTEIVEVYDADSKKLIGTMKCELTGY